MRIGVVLFLLGIVVPRALCQMMGFAEMGEMVAGMLPAGLKSFAQPLAMRMMMQGNMGQSGGGGASGLAATTGGNAGGATGGAGSSGSGMDWMTYAALGGGMAGMGMDQLMQTAMLSNVLGGGNSGGSGGANTGGGAVSTGGVGATSAAAMYGRGGGAGATSAAAMYGAGGGAGATSAAGMYGAGGLPTPGVYGAQVAATGQNQQQSSRNLLMTLAITGHINKVNLMPTPTEAATLAREGVMGIPANIKVLVCPRPKNCLPVTALCEPEKTFTKSTHYVCEGCQICREGAMGLMHLFSGLKAAAGGPGGPGGQGLPGGPGGQTGTAFDSLIGTGISGSVQTGVPQPGGMPVDFPGMAAMGGVNQAQMRRQAAMLAQLRRQRMQQMAPQMGAGGQVDYSQMSRMRQAVTGMPGVSGTIIRTGTGQQMDPQMAMASQQMAITSQQQQQYSDVTPIGYPGTVRPYIPNQGKQTGRGRVKITKTTKTIRVRGGANSGGPTGGAQGGSRAIVMPGPISPRLIKTMREQAQVVSEKMWGGGSQGNMRGNQGNMGGNQGNMRGNPGNKFGRRRVRGGGPPQGNNVGGKKRRGGPPRRGIKPQ